MPLINIGKKVLRIIWISGISLIVLLTAFHFWAVYHAEEIIQDLVDQKSNGKLKLEVRNFKFNWFSRKMELHDAVFYSTDTATATTSYRFAVRKINLRLKAVWPVIFDEEVLIKNLELKDPHITVTQLKAPKERQKEVKVSVPQEMGKIYKSIQDALEVLQVQKFELDNATFNLVNKVEADQQPITISHIDLTIHDLVVDTSKLTGKEKLFFSDNIVVKSRDQDILFPDGRHRLSFQKFRINIEKRIVEFDSCTIAAIKTDKFPTGFSIFFDKLVMNDINFDTLYRTEVIKAESVFCINPIFKFTSDLDKREKSRKAPRLDEIIRKLTGDLVLNYVVVNNASFDISTIRNGNPSSFRSQRNNFEMQGLRIDNDAARPIQVEKFAMAIRDYENFLKDSLYALQFDSIQVNNDRIYLNNFSFQKLDNGKPISNFNVPRFQLSGLSWDDLLFNRKLTAHQATLYNPLIDYKETPKKNTGRQKRTIFDILGNLNDVIMLEDMNIVDGDIRVNLEGGTSLDLKHATMSVQSRELLKSNQLSGIRRSVNYLDFSKGELRINDLLVQLDSIVYTGDRSRLKAKAARVTDISGGVNGYARDVRVNEIFINEFTGDVSIGGIQWEQADINIQKSFSPDTIRKGGASFISLTDIIGSNTRLIANTPQRKISTFIRDIGIDAFLLKPGEKPVIAGLELFGNDLTINGDQSQVSASNYSIIDGIKAVVSDLRYHKRSGDDSTELKIKQISFVPNVQAAIDKEIRASNVVVHQPVFSANTSGNNHGKGPIPKAMVDQVILKQPLLTISGFTKNGKWNFRWNDGEQKEDIILKNLVADSTSVSVSNIDFFLKNFSFSSAGSREWKSKNATLKVDLQDLSYSELPLKNWKATIANLAGKDFEFDSVGRKMGQWQLKNFAIRNLELSDSNLKNLPSLWTSNKNFVIENVRASYENVDDRFDWYNGQFNRQEGTFTLDSFRFVPMLDKDAFAKKRGYQSDYISLKTGKAFIGKFDLDTYFRDSIVRVGKVNVSDIIFNDFRDKRVPFKTGIIKPLIGKRIQSIPFKLWVDSLLINNSQVTYAEQSDVTGEVGTIPITRMNILATPIKNFGQDKNDSLHIHAEGYLMDSAFVKLRIHESYTDSLSGFLVSAHIGPSDLRVLNPVLIPLSSVELKSGKLDSLVMRVNADEYYAYGEVQMFYEDLKIHILKLAGKKSGKFKMALVNFLANSFIVRNKNTNRTGVVFFVRNRERSSLNYLVKMLMSGVNSSIGAKTTKKNLQSYKKQVKQRNLPPANYD